MADHSLALMMVGTDPVIAERTHGGGGGRIVCGNDASLTCRDLFDWMQAKTIEIRQAADSPSVETSAQ
jgi:hypothetical protein